MKLTPGITSCTPEWQLILTQIGVPFSTIDLSVTSGISDCPAIIVSSSLTNSEILKVLEYVSNGGTILIEADTGHLLFNIKTQSLHIKYFEPQYDDIFAAVNGGYFDGQLRLPKHGTQPDVRFRKEPCPDIPPRRRSGADLAGWIYPRCIGHLRPAAKLSD